MCQTSLYLSVFSIIYISLCSGLQLFCRDSTDCSVRIGTTCQNSECICLQHADGAYLRPCPASLGFGDKCSSDADCRNDLICGKAEIRLCKCASDQFWDIVSERCYLTKEDPYVNRRYDLTRDVVIPLIILLSLAITAFLCYRLFCTTKNWRRRRRENDVARALEESQLPVVGSSQPATTWIASYRVFGTVERSGPPCLLLPVGPPPYEEALKHKVILSSYHPPLVHNTPL
ncbi:uncharacterized protein [Halyomorpha halys]|uniref:uncharacterized protein n=1 Tax=Halyomorpha halys TaxID=286706 RepID=UPI0006D4CD87|nr:uncharacterized protein LOC106680146 [Halyomorpha halys]